MAKREASPLTITNQNLINLTQPQHYRLPVPEESRPALQALDFTDVQLDTQECIQAIWDTHGPEAAYWFLVGSGTKYLWRAGHKIAEPTSPWQWLLWHLCPGYRAKVRAQAMREDFAKASAVLARASQMPSFEIVPDINAEITDALELIP